MKNGIVKHTCVVLNMPILIAYWLVRYIFQIQIGVLLLTLQQKIYFFDISFQSKAELQVSYIRIVLHLTFIWIWDLEGYFASR